MQAVFQEAVRLLEQRQPLVVATVVRTKGSTPQKPGAKLLVRQDGSGVGTLGGGCVEGDIWFAARELLRGESGPEHREYQLNEELAAQDGLVCGGTMYFLIDPVRRPEEFLPYAQAVVDAYQGNSTVALASLVKPAGKGKVGDKLFVKDDGTALGTLGTAQRDRQAMERARQLAPYGQHDYLAHKDGSESFLETYTTPPTLVMAGGGHISKAVAPLAKSLGFRLFIVDDRAEFANKERFPEAEETLAMDFVEGLKCLPINANTAIVVATRGHRYDDVALEAAINTPASYVGLVGSLRKVVLIYRDLLAHGVPPERVKAIRSPIGLDIGARTPEEIAVSIMAEIVAFRNGATGRPMKMEERRVDRVIQKRKKRAAAAAS